MIWQLKEQPTAYYYKHRTNCWHKLLVSITFQISNYIINITANLSSWIWMLVFSIIPQWVKVFKSSLGTAVYCQWNYMPQSHWSRKEATDNNRILLCVKNTQLRKWLQMAHLFLLREYLASPRGSFLVKYGYIPRWLAILSVPTAKLTSNWELVFMKNLKPRKFH